MTTVSLINKIGNTPLIYLKKASEISGCKIFGKAEFLNDYIDNNIQDEDKKFFLKKIVSIVLPEAINLLAKINKKKLKSMLKKLRNVFSCNK